MGMERKKTSLVSAKSYKLNQFHAPVVMDLCLSQEVEAGVVDAAVDVEDVVATEVATTVKLTRMAILGEAEEEVEEEEEVEAAEAEDANHRMKKELDQSINCRYHKINSLIISTLRFFPNLLIFKSDET